MSIAFKTWSPSWTVSDRMPLVDRISSGHRTTITPARSIHNEADHFFLRIGHRRSLSLRETVLSWSLPTVLFTARNLDLHRINPCIQLCLYPQTVMVIGFAIEPITTSSLS